MISFEEIMDLTRSDSAGNAKGQHLDPYFSGHSMGEQEFRGYLDIVSDEARRTAEVMSRIDGAFIVRSVLLDDHWKARGKQISILSVEQLYRNDTKPGSFFNKWANNRRTKHLLNKSFPLCNLDIEWNQRRQEDDLRQQHYLLREDGRVYHSRLDPKTGDENKIIPVCEYSPNRYDHPDWNVQRIVTIRWGLAKVLSGHDQTI